MNCLNCNAELRSTFLTHNQLFSEENVSLINSELGLEAETYCNLCGDKLYEEAVSLRKQKDTIIQDARIELRDRRDALATILNENLNQIPVLTTHTPYNWQYTSLELVSGQIVTGTGFVSEFFSDFTDFFGSKSNSFTNKLTKNEETVLNQLRAKAVLLGGNAVIATDIDYGEVGAGKGMLMVCAAGTAIKLHNIEVLEDNKQKILSNISPWQNEMILIENILSSEDINFMARYEKYASKYNI